MKLLKILMLLLLPVISGAQYWEAGAFAGLSNYLGDLTANSQTIYMQNSGFSGAVFARYNINDMTGVRLALGYAELTGTDALANSEAIRTRNLSFSSDVIELALTGELNLPGYQPYNLSRPLSPFLFAGISVFHYNPVVNLGGVDVKLRPLGTEGQGLPDRPARYSAISLAIPMGLGVKYAVTDKLNIGIELGARMTFTDYLDDVSGTYLSYPELLAGNGPLAATLGNRSGELLGGEPVIVPTGTSRGDNRARDWFFNAGLSISYNFLDNGLVGSRNRTRKKAGCRT
jgi:hypothetical protein